MDNQSTGKKSLRILHAEDTQGIRDIVKIVLERAGHTVTSFENGLLAIEYLVGKSVDEFDVVITDNQMPVIDGKVLVGYLRHKGFKGKIVVFSSPPTPQEMEIYRDKLSVKTFLSKAMSPGQYAKSLLDAVKIE